jgi:hypothetical protein
VPASRVRASVVARRAPPSTARNEQHSLDMVMLHDTKNKCKRLLPPPVSTPVNSISAKRQKRPTRARVPPPTGLGNSVAEGDVRAYLARWENEASVMAALRQLAEGKASGGSASSMLQKYCADLRGFIVAYGVHRTFKGLQQNNTAPLAPIVSHIQRRWASRELHRCQSDAAFAVQEVDALADVCKAAGFSRNLSFASKALNMLGLPVPLFSSECVAFLRLPRAASYAAFHAAWSAQYAKHREALETAATRHASSLSPWPGGSSKTAMSAKMSVAVADGSSTNLGEVSAWLCVRALDVRMLREGGPMR